MTTNQTLICRVCQVPAKGIVKEGETEPYLVRCPSCGESGDFEEVMAAAAQHLASDRVGDMLSGLAMDTPYLSVEVSDSGSNVPLPRFILK